MSRSEASARTSPSPGRDACLGRHLLRVDHVHVEVNHDRPVARCPRRPGRGPPWRACPAGARRRRAAPGPGRPRRALAGIQGAEADERHVLGVEDGGAPMAATPPPGRGRGPGRGPSRPGSRTGVVSGVLRSASASRKTRPTGVAEVPSRAGHRPRHERAVAAQETVKPSARARVISSAAARAAHATTAAFRALGAPGRRAKGKSERSERFTTRGARGPQGLEQARLAEGEGRLLTPRRARLRRRSGTPKTATLPAAMREV